MILSNLSYGISINGWQAQQIWKNCEKNKNKPFKLYVTLFLGPIQPLFSKNKKYSHLINL